MKIVSHIRGLYPADVGEQLVSDLNRICPGSSRYGDYVSPPLEQGDPRLAALRARLEQAGLKPHHHPVRASQVGREYSFWHQRRYDPPDLEAAAYLQLDPPQSMARGRNASGVVELDADKSPWDLPVFTEVDGVVVPDRVKRALEGGGLSHVRFRPTRLVREVEHDGATAEMPWGGEEGRRLGGPWWELTSDLSMPPLSPRVELYNNDGERITDGDLSNGVFPHEGFFAKPELHYAAGAVGAMPPFDLARTHEPFGTLAESDGRLLVASRRFYRFCGGHGIQTDWIPVRIDPD